MAVEGERWEGISARGGTGHCDLITSRAHAQEREWWGDIHQSIHYSHQKRWGGDRWFLALQIDLAWRSVFSSALPDAPEVQRTQPTLSDTIRCCLERYGVQFSSLLDSAFARHCVSIVSDCFKWFNLHRVISSVTRLLLTLCARRTTRRLRASPTRLFITQKLCVFDNCTRILLIAFTLVFVSNFTLVMYILYHNIQYKTVLSSIKCNAQGNIITI